MKRNHLVTTVFGIALLAIMAVFLSACSEEYTTPVSNEAKSEQGKEFQYPELTPEMLAAGPAPGYRFLQLPNDRTMDSPPPCDSLSDEGLAGPRHDKTLKIDHLVEVKIRKENMPQDATIRVIAPIACYTVIDCYPHPFQFNGMVEIKWKIKDLDLPNDFDFESLVPLYVTDDGQYVEVAHEWQGNYDKLLVWTDHFSRYIIAQRVGG